MDWVQIYWTVLAVISITIHVGKAISSPNELSTSLTNSQALITTYIRLAVSLPLIGRIFNWW